MFGLFVELGPYYLNQDSLDDPKYNVSGIPQVRRYQRAFDMGIPGWATNLA